MLVVYKYIVRSDKVLSIITLSLKIASTATIIVFIIGIIMSRLLTRYNFPGKDVIETIFLLPMTLPPSVVGYGLLILIGKRGFVGKFMLEQFDYQLIFTWVAATIAAAIVAFPLMYQQSKSAFQEIDPTIEEAARSLGANSFQVFSKVTLPLAMKGILSGVVLTFARALGEFGATLMVAGNIPGRTQNIPLAIYLAVEVGNKQLANRLVLIEVVFSFIVVYGVNFWVKKKMAY